MTHGTELGDLLERSATRWRDRLIERCAAAGFSEMTPTKWAALRPLFEADGQPISEVGERAGLAKSTMTTVVRALERDDLVEVRADPDDMRVRRLWLTARARRLEDVLADGVTRLRHRVTATLGPQGQRELHRTLERLLGSL